MRQQAKGCGPWTRTCNVDWPLSLWHRKSGETENASPVDVEHLLVGRRCLHAPSTQPRRRGVSAILPLPPYHPQETERFAETWQRARQERECAAGTLKTSTYLEWPRPGEDGAWRITNLFANLGTCSQYHPAFRKEVGLVSAGAHAVTIHVYHILLPSGLPSSPCLPRLPAPEAPQHVICGPCCRPCHPWALAIVHHLSHIVALFD